MPSLTPKQFALISNQAFSVINFRGPLVRMLIEHGVVVYAFAPDYDDDTRAAVVALGAIPVNSSISRTGMNPLRDLADLLLLTLQLKRMKLDASFAYFIKPVIYGTLAARLAGVPKRFAMIEGAGYVFTEYAHISISRRLLRFAVSRLYKLGLTHANRVFLLNRDDKELFVGGGLLSPLKVVLLDGIGLNLDHYRYVPYHRTSLSFILVARLLKEKGIYDYVEAARLLKKAGHNARFVLLGGLDLNPGAIAQAEVETWVAEGLIEWPGQVTDVREWIADAGVFVLPSYREGMPRSTQEAMAIGRPVITTDVPGCRDTVVDGENGFLVPVRDPHSLMRAMLRFVESPLLINQMGVKSRQMAEMRFNVNKINEQILQTIKAT